MALTSLAWMGVFGPVKLTTDVAHLNAFDDVDGLTLIKKGPLSFSAQL
jgi:hypothetical protein